MKSKYDEAAGILKALGHPTRLQIVEGLLRDGCNVSHIVQCLGIPQATVSQHIGILKACGVIEGERKGTQICYRISNKNVEKILKALL